VRVVRGSHGDLEIRFAPKAAKLYRTIGGRRAQVGCGTVTGKPVGQGFYTTGYLSGDFTIPQRRQTLHTMTDDNDAELCAVASKRVKSDRSCLPLSQSSKPCTRLVVAVTDSDRAYLERRAHTIALGLTVLAAEVTPVKLPPLGKARAALGDDVVGLESPHASPPAGKVGYFNVGTTIAAVTLLPDGTRLFVRWDDTVFSTNVPEFYGLANDEAYTLM
jgi:hypothetical protein